MGIGAIDTSVVVIYLLAMVGVGVWVSRRLTGFDDFFVAGGRMTTPLLVCTLVSTYYGLDVTFGTSETAYNEGMAAFFAYSAPFYVAYVCMALLVAPRIRELPAISLPECMGHFYGRTARVLAAAASFVYSAPILAVGGMGLIGSVFFGMEPWVAMAIGAAISLVYTALGGLLADALTDTVQFTMMCVTAAIAAFVAMGRIGDHVALEARLGSEVFEPLGELTWTEILVYGSVAATPLVEPAFYQRTFAAKGGREIVKALLIGIVLWMAYDWVIVYLGISGRELVREGVLPGDVAPVEVLLLTMGHLLPQGLLGIFLAGCLASAMSTIDSYTLIGAGNLTYDIIEPLTGRRPTDANLLRLTRICLVVTLSFALWVALYFESLRDAWIFMSTILLSTVFVPMLAALFVLRVPRPRAGTWSAAAGLVASVALFACFLWLGREDADAGSVVWSTPIGVDLIREEALLVSVPVSFLAFLAGYAADCSADPVEEQP